MSPVIFLGCMALYFAGLLAIAAWTSRNADNRAYYLGNKASPWYAVAFGLLGDSLSGVTFISVPGQVGAGKFSYFQIVLGYVLGYVVIAEVLLPLYYRLNLTSIYTYLLGRFGAAAQKTGAFFFLVSRAIGAAFRLYLAALVLHLFVFDRWQVPFSATVATIIVLILVYTLKGGIRTLVWTDTFQSTFLLLGVVLSLVSIGRQLDLSFAGMIRAVAQSEYSQIFVWDWRDRNFFGKHFLSGAFIAIAMTGLDQNMMQKNLSCRTLADARRNIYAFTAVMLVVNLCFLALGALLYLYAGAHGIAVPRQSDQLFPLLALQHLGAFAAIVFLLGLTAATFSSADSVLTTLTTSFCIDFIGLEADARYTEAQKIRRRMIIHAGFAVLLLALILIFRAVNNDAVINAIFRFAGYTYGPLLGLFGFGILTRAQVRDGWVPLVCVLAPVLTYLVEKNAGRWLGGYQFGFEVLLLNGALTFAGLALLSRRSKGGGEVEGRESRVDSQRGE